jgi:hypothetical protein
VAPSLRNNHAQRCAQKPAPCQAFDTGLFEEKFESRPDRKKLRIFGAFSFYIIDIQFFVLKSKIAIHFCVLHF